MRTSPLILILLLINSCRTVAQVSTCSFDLSFIKLNNFTEYSKKKDVLELFDSSEFVREFTDLNGFRSNDYYVEKQDVYKNLPLRGRVVFNTEDNFVRLDLRIEFDNGADVKDFVRFVKSTKTNSFISNSKSILFMTELTDKCAKRFYGERDGQDKYLIKVFFSM